MKETNAAKSGTQAIGHSSAEQLRIGLLRGLGFALVWWVLTDGVYISWVIGVPTVALATWVSLVLLPASSWSLSGIFLFIPFFIWQSIRGGLNVAGIALDSRLPLSPMLYDYRLRLPPGLPRVIMCDVVNLLPGTLSVNLDADVLRIHLLDEQGNHAEDLLRLENLIMAFVSKE